MSSAHTLTTDLYNISTLLPDPGDAGDIVVTATPAMIELESAAAETRGVDDPGKEDLDLTLVMVTDGGDITMTFDTGYDEAGSTSMVFSAIGQFVCLKSIADGAGGYAWRVVGYDGVTGPALSLASISTGAISGNDSSLGIAGQAAAQGGTVLITGGASSTTANAGGPVTIVGGAGGATGVGGAISATTAAGQNIAAAGTATAGGLLTLATGAGGTTATGTGGAGGDIAITGGAGGAASGAGTGGAGASITLTPGAGGAHVGGTAGVDGAIIESGFVVKKQGAQTAKTVSATLTAAELRSGIITVNQAGAATSAQQLPADTAMTAAFPDIAVDHGFEFSVINTSTVDAEDASITTNTGWTLTGSMDIHAYSAAGSLNSSARFFARRTAAGTWTLYRIA